MTYSMIHAFSQTENMHQEKSPNNVALLTLLPISRPHGVPPNMLAEMIFRKIEAWQFPETTTGLFQHSMQVGLMKPPLLIATALSVAVCASTQTSLGTLGTRVFREVGLS